MKTEQQRVIKFRGLSADQGRVWCYGFYTEESGRGYIRNERGFVIEVDRSTVGQFTGLHDKAGKEIFEDDIVSAWSEGYNHRGRVKWILDGMPRIIIYPAFANQGFWGLHGSIRNPGDAFIHVTGKLEVVKGNESKIVDDGVEVIGNVHQDKHILE